MNLALAHSRARSGVDAPAVTVEVHMAGGLPRLSVVGLPEAAVREAKDRVRAAILCSGMEFPPRAITVNLAPADLPKHGGRFDLPIALCILAASGQLPQEALGGIESIAELGLTGELKPTQGVLSAAVAARDAGRVLIVAPGNAAEAALVRDADVRVARTLSEVSAMLQQTRSLPRAAESPESPALAAQPPPDLADVRGQFAARRALEVAAAGGHHLLFVGSPGCGKSLLAARLPGILPRLSEEEALETAAIASAAGMAPDARQWRCRPFRSPHHSASAAALIGGGSQARPGEVSLAHNGVLFMDEFTQWPRHVLDALREPLETGVVDISRAARRMRYPARFQLLAAMNPCPCGWAGDASERCSCPPEGISRYKARVSGPILDRIDLHVAVSRVAASALRHDAPPGESSAVVRARVEQARERQRARAGCSNAYLAPEALRRDCALAERDQALLETAAERLRLSARALHRITRVARTIADLDGCASIGTPHLTEALGYRPG